MTLWSLLPKGLKYLISSILSSSFDKIKSKRFYLFVTLPLVGFLTCWNIKLSLRHSMNLKGILFGFSDLVMSGRL